MSQEIDGKWVQSAPVKPNSDAPTATQSHKAVDRRMQSEY